TSDGTPSRRNTRRRRLRERRLAGADGLDARGGFGRWRRVVLFLQPTPECLESAQRSGAIPRPVEQRDEAREPFLVVRIEGDALARGLDGLCQIALLLRMLRQLRRRPCRELPQADPLAFDPPLELGGSARYVEAVEEIAAIELHGF